MIVRRFAALVLALSLAVPTVHADDAPRPEAIKRWKNVTMLSLVNTTGNTRSSTSSGSNAFTYDWSQTRLELVGGGVGSKSRGVTIAERYYANEKVSYKLSDRNYAFQRYGWDKDRFAGIKNRHDLSLGLGRELMKRVRDELVAEFGSGFVSEERKNARTNDFASGRIFSRYTHKLSATASFRQDVEYLHNYEDRDDFRVNTESALVATLSEHFALQVSYVHRHVGKPPRGFDRNDTMTTVGLLATY